jgi:hypothetical protein
MRTKLTCVLVVALALTASTVWPPAASKALAAQIQRGDSLHSPNPMNVTTDILVLRPVGLVMIPVLGLVYLIGLPFAATSDSVAETHQALIGDTIDFTFKRPLGRGAPFE